MADQVEDDKDGTVWTPFTKDRLTRIPKRDSSASESDGETSDEERQERDRALWANDQKQNQDLFVCLCCQWLSDYLELVPRLTAATIVERLASGSVLCQFVQRARPDLAPTFDVKACPKTQAATDNFASFARACQLAGVAAPKMTDVTPVNCHTWLSILLRFSVEFEKSFSTHVGKLHPTTDDSVSAAITEMCQRECIKPAAIPRPLAKTSSSFQFAGGMAVVVGWLENRLVVESAVTPDVTSASRWLPWRDFTSFALLHIYALQRFPPAALAVCPSSPEPDDGKDTKGATLESSSSSASVAKHADRVVQQKQRSSIQDADRIDLQKRTKRAKSTQAQQQRKGASTGSDNS